MDYKKIIEKNKPEFEKALEFFKTEISAIRTGKATPALVEDLIVEVYDGKFRMQELATITAPEPRVLVIQPWDRQVIQKIENAIRKNNLGLNPIVEGQQIRLNFPSLTEERRREFIKLLKQKAEESRIKIRRLRENIWEEIQKMEKEGEIREDDKFRGKEELQKTTDEYNKKIEDIEKKKEGELLTS